MILEKKNARIKAMHGTGETFVKEFHVGYSSVSI